jgi:hypothetical protein
LTGGEFGPDALWTVSVIVPAEATSLAFAFTTSFDVVTVNT